MSEKGGTMDYTAIVVAIIGSGVLNTLLNYWISSKDKKNNKDENANKALRLLMKDRLRSLCGHYIQQGWIYEDELEDIIAMHNCYHDKLKGNGFLDKQMSRVMSLEIRGIGVK